MQPLLRIQTVPISLEFRTQRAQLTSGSGNGDIKQPRANVGRSRGRAYIQSTPAKVHIDSYETRASAGIKSAPRSIQEFAEAGRAAAREAAQNYAEEGNQIVDSHGQGYPIAEIAASKMIKTSETIMAFIPSVPPEITVEEGSISFDYTPDQLNYDWNVSTRPQLEYVPGSIEFTVEQYPEVIIEYIGSPIYVPPSSDPNYEG